MSNRRMWTIGVSLAVATVVAAFGAVSCSSLGFPLPPLPTATTTDHPSPARAGSSSASASAAGKRDCASRPSACGYPDATNTGGPAGTALAVHEGDLQIRTAGTVVANLDIRGCVSVLADNVTIRSSKISCTSNWGIGSFADDNDGGLVVEDVEVDCQGTGGTALGSDGLVARRVNLHGCENGVDIGHGVTVEDSYIHDMVEVGGGHADGIQFGGEGNAVIAHNTIEIPDGTSAIITGHGGPFNGVTIENNLLGGGAYTLYCPDQPGSVDFRVLDNRFIRTATYGPWTDCASIDENRGNIWDETLVAVEPA